MAWFNLNGFLVENILHIVYKAVGQYLANGLQPAWRDKSNNFVILPDDDSTEKLSLCVKCARLKALVEATEMRKILLKVCVKE